MADYRRGAMEDAQPRDRRQLRRLFWVLAILLAAASSVAAYAWTERQAEDPAVQLSLEDLATGDLTANEIAPDFTVPTLDGGSFSLSAHLADDGRPVLLNLWASWCPPCRAEMPALDAAAARHPNIKFVGVAVQDDLRAAEEFAAEIGVGYTIAFDQRDEVNALYPSVGLPVSYLISPAGTILRPIFGELSESDLDALFATFFGG